MGLSRSKPLPLMGRGWRGVVAVLAGLLAAAPVPAFAAECPGLAGQYFFDVNNPGLDDALNERLGNARRRFVNRYEVQTPFESTGDGYVYASACMAHSCTIEEAFLGIEESTCQVYVALLEDSKYTLVLPRSPWPASLEKARRDWMNQ